MPVRFHRALFATLCLTLPLFGQAEPLVLQAAQIKSLGIAIAPVGSDTAAGSRLPGRVLVPNAQMRIVSAPVAGMIEQLTVAPGTPVKRGQVLAYLASPQALELQRDALQAGSQSALLQQSLKRDEQLYAEGLIPESRLQATRAAAAQAGAMASERRQGLALAGLAPGKLGGPLQLQSPIDGVVLEQGVQVGQRVETAAMIFSIARLSPLWLEIQAPQEMAASLHLGATLKLAGSTVNGKLIAIGRAIDPVSQTVLLRAEVTQGAERLSPGQAIEVEAASSAAGGNRVPASALIRHQADTLVFVQTASSEQGIQLQPRPVRVLNQGSDSVRVEGLQAGEKIAIKGVSGLKAMLAGVGKE